MKIKEKLTIALLKEKIERTTGKKVVFKEDINDAELHDTQEEKRGEHLQGVQTDILANEPHSKEREDTQRKLRNLIERFDRDTQRLELAKQPFLEQINLIQKQLSAVEGEIPERLQQQEQEIMDLMAELNITTKKVGTITAQLQTTPPRKSAKYKEIVTGIEAFDGFLDQYETAYKELVAKYTSFSELRKSLTLHKENYMLKEGMFSNLFKVIGNIFSSITRTFRNTIFSGNKAANKLEKLL
jgi:chromosome segregation ATPase